MKRADRKVVFELLRRIEQEGSTGLVQLLDNAQQPLGHVMVAGGRLCYAAPREGHARIGELLAKGNPVFELRIAKAVRDAKARGVRLCEALLEAGMLNLDAIRAGLREQTSHALLAMTSSCPAGWTPAMDLTPARDDYDRRLTFSAIDIFLAISQALDTAPPDGAARVYEEFAASSEGALLLVRGTGEASLPLPVAARGLEETSLSQVVKIARAAADMSRPAPLAKAGIEPRVIVFSGRGGVWVGATTRYRIALIRTNPQYDAGQVVGLALRFCRQDDA